MDGPVRLSGKATSPRQAIFRRLPFRRELFLALRLVGRPSFYRQLYFDGTFRVPIDQRHSFLIHQNNRYGIETELFWRGIFDAWEAASLGVWIKLCGDAEVILDIGAAEGLYALVANALRPSAHVLAFEPAPQRARELARNIALNRHGSRCFQMALADYTGEVPFFQDSPFSDEGHLVREPSASVSLPVVEVTTVEKILEEEGLNRLDLVKIDVEGAEPEVLMGMGQLLARHRPSMIVEILSDDAGGRVEEIIKGLDYLYFDINDDLRNGPRNLERAEHLRSGRCLNYLIIQPGVADRIGII